jgi:hypothetical protein
MIEPVAFKGVRHHATSASSMSANGLRAPGARGRAIAT